MSNSRVLKARSYVAHEAKKAKQTPQPTPPLALIDARRELAAAKLEAHIRTVLAGAVPLTPAMRDALAALLRGA